MNIPAMVLGAAWLAVQYINPDTLAKSPRYSHVAVVSEGRMIFISGEVAMGPDGKLVGEGDFKAQAQQVFRNLQAALASAGATPDDVVSINTYMLRLSDMDDYRAARSAFFAARKSPPPTSTTVAVAGLVTPGALLEVSVTAVIPAPKKR
jgi:enamine deaminase RidA (YjgF/YER057c/UK114 family)